MNPFFRYKVVPVFHSVVSLGGRWSRPRPLVAVSVIGSSNTRPIDGLLDTGAEDKVFPERLASLIGVDVENAPHGQMRRANGSSVSVHYAQVILRLADGVERREWPAWVGFSPIVHRPLLAVRCYSSEAERRKSLPAIMFSPLPCTQGRGE